MRNILRLALFLAVVGIFSAAALSVVNDWTAPIIAERTLREYLDSVREFFPNVGDYREETLDGNKYDLIYDSNGNLIGVIGKMIRQTGYAGPITYNLVINSAGEIMGYRIVSHSETPGIGDIILKPDFAAKFTGKTHDRIDVDTVSGATVTTSALIGSIRRIAAAVAVNFLGVEEEVFDISAVPDGIYEGTGEGLMGDITVNVTVAGGRITAITVLDHQETPKYYILADPATPDLIIAEQRLEVDTLTEATGTSEGIVQAVRDALQKALEAAGGDNGE